MASDVSCQGDPSRFGGIISLVNSGNGQFKKKSKPVQQDDWSEAFDVLVRNHAELADYCSRIAFLIIFGPATGRCWGTTTQDFDTTRSFLFGVLQAASGAVIFNGETTYAAMPRKKNDRWHFPGVDVCYASMNQMLLQGKSTAQFTWQLDLALRNPATIAELNYLATRPADIHISVLSESNQGMGTFTWGEVDETQAEVQKQVVAKFHAPTRTNGRELQKDSP